MHQSGFGWHIEHQSGFGWHLEHQSGFGWHLVHQSGLEALGASEWVGGTWCIRVDWDGT